MEQQQIGNNYHDPMQAWNNNMVLEVWVKLTHQYPNDPETRYQHFWNWCHQQGWRDMEIEQLIEMINVTPMDDNANFSSNEWVKKQKQIVWTVNTNLDELHQAKIQGKNVFATPNKDYVDTFLNKDSKQEFQIVDVSFPSYSQNHLHCDVQVCCAKNTPNGLVKNSINVPLVMRSTENSDPVNSMFSDTNSPIELNVEDEEDFESVDECLEKLGNQHDDQRTTDKETGKTTWKKRQYKKVHPEHIMHKWISQNRPNLYPTIREVQEDEINEQGFDDPYAYLYVVPEEEARSIAEMMINNNIKRRFKADPSQLRIVLSPDEDIVKMSQSSSLPEPDQKSSKSSRYTSYESIKASSMSPSLSDNKSITKENISSSVLSAAFANSPIRDVSEEKINNLVSTNFNVKIKCNVTYLERKKHE